MFPLASMRSHRGPALDASAPVRVAAMVAVGVWRGDGVHLMTGKDTGRGTRGSDTSHHVVLDS